MPPRWDCSRSCVVGAPRQLLSPPRRIATESHWKAVLLDELVHGFGHPQEGRGTRGRPVLAPHPRLCRLQQCEELAMAAAPSATPPRPRSTSDVMHGLGLPHAILCLRQVVVVEAGLGPHVGWDHSCGISGHIANNQQKGQTKLFENQILCSRLLLLLNRGSIPRNDKEKMERKKQKHGKYGRKEKLA